MSEKTMEQIMFVDEAYRQLNMAQAVFEELSSYFDYPEERASLESNTDHLCSLSAAAFTFLVNAREELEKIIFQDSELSA